MKFMKTLLGGQRSWRVGFAMVFVAVSLAPVFSAEAPTQLKVEGDVENPLQLGPSDLQSLPRVKLRARDHEGNAGNFEGVALWNIIDRAKPRLGGKPNSSIANGFMVVKAADNYQAVFSLAEIDPGFTDNKIILVDTRDGKPIAPPQGPLQLIVPGDKIHARWVREVTVLEVVTKSRTAAGK
jgi:DMSO/TMAO reductase YedYZ molybdopterin-dependent catalytic subunit